MHDRGWFSNHTVYDLSVASTHTYYVAESAQAEGALVHNMACSVGSNRARGQAWENEISDYLRSTGAEVRNQVSYRTPFGRRVVDIEVYRNGRLLGAIEAKVGGSRYTVAQRAKDWWLKQHYGITTTVVRRR